MGSRIDLRRTFQVVLLATRMLGSSMSRNLPTACSGCDSEHPYHPCGGSRGGVSGLLLFLRLSLVRKGQDDRLNDAVLGEADLVPNGLWVSEAKEVGGDTEHGEGSGDARLR